MYGFLHDLTILFQATRTAYQYRMICLKGNQNVLESFSFQLEVSLISANQIKKVKKFCAINHTKYLENSQSINQSINQ